MAVSTKSAIERRHVDGEIGSRIRLRRTMLGLSQKELGDTIGITPQQVQKYEKGTNRIAASTLFIVAEALRLVRAHHTTLRTAQTRCRCTCGRDFQIPSHNKPGRAPPPAATLPPVSLWTCRSPLVAGYPGVDGRNQVAAKLHHWLN